MGTLPGAWAQRMSRLVHLDLNSNNFTGSVPTEWTAPGAFAQLQSLFLGHTYLSGPLPGEGSPSQRQPESRACWAELAFVCGLHGGCSRYHACSGTDHVFTCSLFEVGAWHLFTACKRSRLSASFEFDLCSIHMHRMRRRPYQLMDMRIRLCLSC